MNVKGIMKVFSAAPVLMRINVGFRTVHPVAERQAA